MTSMFFPKNLNKKSGLPNISQLIIFNLSLGPSAKYIPPGCFTPIGVYKNLVTLNPENIPVNVISIDI
jgi:hypothetical protein